MDNRPEWMNDPLVKNIEEKKLQFLSELVLGGRGKRGYAIYDAENEAG